MRISDGSSDVCSSDLPVIATASTLVRCQNRPKQYVEPNSIVTAGRGVLRHCESVRTRQRAQTLLVDGGPFLWACSIAHAHDYEAACTREHALGREACRARVCQSVSLSVVALTYKTTQKT